MFRQTHSREEFVLSRIIVSSIFIRYVCIFSCYVLSHCLQSCEGFLDLLSGLFGSWLDKSRRDTGYTVGHIFSLLGTSVIGESRTAVFFFDACPKSWIDLYIDCICFDYDIFVSRVSPCGDHIFHPSVDPEEELDDIVRGGISLESDSDTLFDEDFSCSLLWWECTVDGCYGFGSEFLLQSSGLSEIKYLVCDECVDIEELLIIPHDRPWLCHHRQSSRTIGEYISPIEPEDDSDRSHRGLLTIDSSQCPSDDFIDDRWIGCKSVLEGTIDSSLPWAIDLVSSDDGIRRVATIEDTHDLVGHTDEAIDPVWCLATGTTCKAGRIVHSRWCKEKWWGTSLCCYERDRDANNKNCPTPCQSFDCFWCLFSYMYTHRVSIFIASDKSIVTFL